MDKIFISTSSFGKYDPAIIDALKGRGLEPFLNPYGRKLSKSEIMQFLGGMRGLIAGTEVLDRDVLHSSRSLKVISRCGVGMENVDSKAAEELGIKIFNTPDAPTVAVAELTVGLILSILRCVPASDRGMRAGLWEKRMGSLLHGKKVGIIGLGRIGKKVVELIMPFGVEILCYDLKLDNEFIDKYGIKNMSLRDLLTNSDIVTLHISSQEKKSPLIGRQEIGFMKKSAYLINASRGNIVDEVALVEALKDRRISGAAIDVYEKEPYQGPLSHLDNIVLTPHIGSYAKEARMEMEKEAVKNLIRGLGL
ncbi:phosphoglycerate dehydrogenase [Candidatus Omnitrophota bacterium]